MPHFAWPQGFSRIPDEDWTRAPVDTLAAKYDTVENHGWYANLDPTVEDLRLFLGEGNVLLDYSGGTGILVDRLLAAMPATAFGVVNVDSSPKFLRLALEKQRDEPRVAFRLIRYLKSERRLQLLDEVLDAALRERGVDAIASTNAIHLYYDLGETLASWRRALRPAGRVFVQSGNVLLPPGARERGWIIDDTVRAIARSARDVAREESRFAAHRPVLDEAARMAAHEAYLDRVFLPARPLSHYVDAFRAAGFSVERVAHHPVRARVDEWREFLAVYVDAILGWVGGSEKVEGRTPTPEALRDREALLDLAMARVFEGGREFEAVWTYVTCARA